MPISQVSARLILIAFCATAILGTAPPAKAATGACGAIERQMAKLGSGGTGRAARQRATLETTAAHAKAFRCGSGSRPKPCDVLLPAIGKMKANLVRLEALEGGKPAGRAGESRLRAQWRSKGCAEPAGDKPARSPLLAFFMRSETSSQAVLKSVVRPKEVALRQTRPSKPQKRAIGGSRRARPADREAAAVKASAGPTYRTLCVRRCDGYFFPISFSTTADHFADDTARCAARCPGMEVSLYSHPVPQEDVETMTSTVDGTPYAGLASAFLYKLKGPQNTAACGCRVAPPEAASLAELQASKAGTRTPVLVAVAVPTPRPGRLSEDAFRPDRDVAATNVVRPIRVVGPRFYPDR